MKWIAVIFFGFASFSDWAMGVASFLGWYHPTIERISLHAFTSSATTTGLVAYLFATNFRSMRMK